MTNLSPELRNAVIQRTGNRCEYCGLSQVGQEAVFHVDHVLPRASGGLTTFANLALACVSCSLHKAAKVAAVDPQSGEEVPLFNPRLQKWADEFQWEGEVVSGRSALARATVEALRMNRPLIIAIRKEEAVRGRHPPV